MDLGVKNTLIALVLFLIKTNQAFHTLIPDGKELIYEYEGTIKASTEFPKPFLSTFALFGDLHVHRDNKAILMRFSNLTYELYNGAADNYKSEIVGLSREDPALKGFYGGFKIKHDVWGNAAGIAVGGDEEDFVLNFKKGLGLLFQLDLESIEDFDDQETFAFCTRENSLYGNSKVCYDVNADKQSYYINVIYDEIKQPFGNNKNGLSQNSHRSCVLGKKGGDKVIDNIQQKGIITHMPYNGKAEEHLVETNQKLRIKSIGSIQEKIKIENEIYTDDLRYKNFDFNQINSTSPDVTAGRKNYEININAAVDSIKEIFALHKEYKIENKKPDLKKLHGINNIVETLARFNETSLDEVYIKLNENDVLEKIYVQILHAVGTHSSYYYLMTLIKEGEISFSTLGSIFENVRFPNEKLVKDMWEIFFNAPDGALIHFGTLLRKANQMRLNTKYNCYEIYIKMIVDELKTTHDYEKKVVYLQTLQNARFESIKKHMLALAKGNFFKDDYLQILSAQILVEIPKSGDEVFQILAPIISSFKTSTTLRILAYYTLMQTRLDQSKFFNIHRLIESSGNHELYKFHYEYVKAQRPRDLKLLKKPISVGLVVYKFLDYTNQDFGLTEAFDAIVIYCAREKDLLLRISYKNEQNPPSWFFLRVADFEPKLKLKPKNDLTNLFAWRSFLKTIKDSLSGMKATCDVAINGNAETHVEISGSGNVDYFELFLNGFEKSSADISFDSTETQLLTTDMGFPAIYKNLSPKTDFTTSTSFIEIKSKTIEFSERGLAFYNPFLDVFQGVSKLSVEDREFYLGLKFLATGSQHGFAAKLSTSFIKENGGRFFAEREYSASAVYVEDGRKSGVLQVSNPKCANVEFATLGDQYKTQAKINSISLPDFGSDYSEFTFEQEQPTPSQFNLDSVDILDLKNTLRAFLSLERIGSPRRTNANYGNFKSLQLKPTYKSDSIQTNLTYSFQYKKDSPDFDMEFNLEHEAEKTGFSINGVFSFEKGDVSNAFSLNISRNTEELDFKYCLGGDFTTNGNLKLKMFISTDLINGGKCNEETPIINIELSGEQSLEQQEALYEYEDCRENVKGFIDKQKSFDCLYENAALKSYSFKINNSISEDVNELSVKQVDYLFAELFSKPEIVEKMQGVQSGEVSGYFVLPIRPVDRAELVFSTEKYGKSYKLSERVKLSGINNVYDSTFAFLHHLGFTDVCVVDNLNKKVVDVFGMETEKRASNDWDLYFTQPEFRILIKSTDGINLALKIINGNHSVVIKKNDEKFAFHLDENELDLKSSHFTNDWIYFVQYKNAPILSAYVKSVGCHIAFNGYQVYIESPAFDEFSNEGYCFK